MLECIWAFKPATARSSGTFISGLHLRLCGLMKCDSVPAELKYLYNNISKWNLAKPKYQKNHISFYLTFIDLEGVN